MIKHYKAPLLSVINRVWHFTSIQFPPRRRTQVHFHTLSWFRCFLTEKLWGKQWPEYHNHSFERQWSYQQMLNPECEKWVLVWKCKVSPWHPEAPADRPRTPQVPCDGTSLSCLGSCDIVVTLTVFPREQTPLVVGMPRTLVSHKQFLQPPSRAAGIRDRSTWICRNSQWPQWCPCANSAGVLGMDWLAAALPWHFSPYTNPFLPNKPQDHIF